MNPWGASITGNVIWTVAVSALVAVVVIPTWRDQLSPESLSTNATAAMATLSALCMAAAGFVWRGKLEAQAGNGTGGNGGTTTTTIPQTPPADPIIVTTTPTGTVTDTGKEEPRVSPLDT